MSEKDLKESNITSNIKMLIETINHLYIPSSQKNKDSRDVLEKYVYTLNNIMNQVVGSRSIEFPDSLMSNFKHNREPTPEQYDEYLQYLVS